MKGCPSAATHKSELGLVRLGLSTSDAVASAADDMLEIMSRLGLVNDGVIVAPMVRGVMEGMIGAHVDAVFGPIVLVGAGGKYVEALDDVQALIPPFDESAALAAIQQLHIAPLLSGVRGEPPTDVEAWARAAVALGQLMLDNPAIQSVDVNPLMIGAAFGEPSFGALAVDAVVELA